MNSLDGSNFKVHYRAFSHSAPRMRCSESRAKYRRIINDQGIRASQYRRICDDQGIRASQYRRTCDGHSKPRAYKNSSDGWSRFFSGSNLTIQFPQKETSSLFFTGTKVQLAHLDATVKSESRYRASAASVDEAGHLTPPTPLLQHSACTFDLQQSS